MTSTFDTSALALHPDAIADTNPRRELLTPLPERGHYLMVIDNSSLEKIKRCHTAAAYYLFFSREGHARNAALTFGGAVHKGIEVMERGGDDLAVAKAIIQFFTENPTVPDEYRTAQTAIEVLVHYRERCTLPDYQWTILHRNDEPLIEVPFELPLGVLETSCDIQLPTWEQPQRVDYIHVAWSGRMDVIANVNERYRVVDHKTTSIAGDQFVQAFQISSQTLGYVWAAQQLYPSYNVDGFCLNAIHLKKPASGVGLLDRGPRGGAPSLNFFRAFFDYTPQRVQEWSQHTLVMIEDWVHSLVRGHFPLNDHSCFNKYGQCPYWDVCTQDEPEVRVRYLLSDAFKDVTWNPTHK